MEEKKHMGTEVTVGKGQEAPVEEIATKMNMIQGKNHVQNRRKKNKKRAPWKNLVVGTRMENWIIGKMLGISQEVEDLAKEMKMKKEK